MDVDRGAYTGRDTCAHSSGGTKLGGIGKHSSSIGHGAQRFVLSMGHGGPGLHKTRDGYYYDVEGVRYRHLGEEGQYTYEQVTSVFEADNDRVSSLAVDAMVSKAIDYVTTDTPLGCQPPRVAAPI
jgi:hypothetical protein